MMYSYEDLNLIQFRSEFELNRMLKALGLVFENGEGVAPLNIFEEILLLENKEKNWNSIHY